MTGTVPELSAPAERCEVRCAAKRVAGAAAFYSWRGELYDTVRRRRQLPPRHALQAKVRVRATAAHATRQACGRFAGSARWVHGSGYADVLQGAFAASGQ